MRKSELFVHILDCVSLETEISKEDILSSNKCAEIVDARYMLVYLLSRNGFYYREIARLSGISRQAVSRMVSYFRIRRCKGGNIFEDTLKRVCKTLEIN